MLIYNGLFTKFDKDIKNTEFDAKFGPKKPCEKLENFAHSVVS
jgi:hypothetical protein